MNALSAHAGYRLWAPTYADETAISRLDTLLVDAMSPAATGLRLLDAGCGTGRRLRGTGAAKSVGVDLSCEMLAAGAALEPLPPEVATLVGDVRSLPLPDASFDLIWCRLVIGHLPDCAPVYGELGRVAASGAHLVVTDFHPAAFAAGHRRTFRDSDATVREVEHYVHQVGDHLAAAGAAGFTLLEVREGKVGPEVLGFYEATGRADLYVEQRDLPLVLALAFRRDS